MKTLEKFDVISIAQCQYHCTPLIILVLYIYIDMEIVKNNQNLQSNDKKNRLELRDAPPQKIP